MNAAASSCGPRVRRQNDRAGKTARGGHLPAQRAWSLTQPKDSMETALVVSMVGDGRSYRVIPNGRTEPVRLHGSYLEVE